MYYKSNFTGEQLDEALSLILNGNNGGGSSNNAVEILTVLVPSKNTFMEDCNDSSLIEHNINVYNTLKETTKPTIVFLQELHNAKPFSQIAMRMRHLDEKGEGEDYFAFGYSVPHTSEDKYGLLAYSDDMYKLTSDGKIKMISLLGDNRLDYFYTWDTYSKIVANYTQHYTSNANVPSISFVEIEVYHSLDYIKLTNLFGGDTINYVYWENVEYNNGRITSFTIPKGWTSNSFGPIDIDIKFDVDYSEGTWPVFKLHEPIKLGGWADIDIYELRFDSLV